MTTRQKVIWVSVWAFAAGMTALIAVELVTLLS